MRVKSFATTVLLTIAGLLSGCDTGLQHMGTTEYGVKFRALPPFLGGGVGSAESVVHPLQTVIVLPWEKIYRFDTSPQYLSWGRGMGDGGVLTLLKSWIATRSYILIICPSNPAID